MSQDKRAALFEYFKETNAPKWAQDGARLYKTLQEVPNAKIDQMYARMIQLKARAELLKQQKEKPVYKRWKSPLALFIVWGGACLYFFNAAKPDYALACLDAFIAGSYFEEFMNNAISNYFERKYARKNETP